jgi:DNA invertase Pin-like site-specific DNA recombinase
LQTHKPGPITIAGIYARKSTEQMNVDADAKSVANQIANARAFAQAKGWTVADAHIYADDAISGAETTKLVNRLRMLEALAGDRPPFHVLIMRDASRFSRRDGDEAFSELKAMAKAGIAVWFYQDATRFEYGTFAANITGFVRAEMNAEYRRQITRWTTEAMVRKATAGHVCGGKVFGYDNVRVNGHVERRINESQAAVIRRIFDMSASGSGYTRIAKQLNAEGVPVPRPPQGRPAGWGPSSVYDVLNRPLYRGHMIWNKTKTRDAEGKTAVTKRPESDWLRFDRPELRIVSEDLWAAAHNRLRPNGNQLPTAHGLRAFRRRDIESKYLLSGFARCATCGGSLSVMNRSHGGKRRAFYYGCLAHWTRGKTVCENTLILPIARVEAAVLAELQQSLRPAVVRALIAAVFDALRPQTVTANVKVLQGKLRDLDRKIARLTAAIESGAALAPIVAQLHSRQTEREELLASIAAADAVQQLEVDRTVVEQKMLERVDSWRERLASASTPADRRAVLRAGLDGPIRFKAEGRRYRFSGRTLAGRLLEGLVGLPAFLASPRGYGCASRAITSRV